MENEILLTITMLVSDREDTIEKCLSSLSGLMKAVSSELIVVDTAGNEKCMSVVREYTDKIVKFKWCNDFAAARNAGLRKASGQWVMFLDDDEWFEDTKELEAFFTEGLCYRYNTAAYIVRNYLNREGSIWKDSVAMRLAKRGKTTQFVGKIHESLSPLNQPICYMKDYAHHYGYVYDTEQERIEHSWRNIQPLLARKRENPEDYHAIAQLIQEYGGTKDYFAALELIKEIKGRPQSWSPRKIGFTSYALVKEIEIYRIQHRFKDAYKCGKEQLCNDKNLLFVKGSLLNQLVGICYQLEKYGEAVQYIRQFKEVMKEWKSSDRYDKQDIFRISQPYMLEAELSRFSFMELHIHVLQENWEDARGTILEIDWEDNDIRMILNTAEDVVKTLARAPFQEQYLKALKLIAENPVQKAAVCKAVEELEEQQYWNILEFIYQLPLANMEICRYHIRYASRQGDASEIEAVLKEMAEKPYPVLLEDAQYWRDLQQNGINLAPYVQNVHAYEWMEIVNRLMDKLDTAEREWLYLALTKGLDKKDIRFLTATALWTEKNLPDAESQGAKEIWKGLYHAALCWMSCAALLYREDVFMGDLIDAVPPQYQFAWYMMQANAVREKSSSLFIQKVSEAAKAYPAMKELCKKVIREYSEIL